MGLTIMLHYYSHHPSSLQSLHRPSRMPPPSVAVRNYNLAQWKITQRAMRAKCFHLHAEKRRLWAAWNSLGAKLEFGTDSSRNEFGPLQRCANQACMCSVYKCPRPMKSCKGCYLAAYCNRNCQEKYVHYATLVVLFQILISLSEIGRIIEVSVLGRRIRLLALLCKTSALD